MFGSIEGIFGTSVGSVEGAFKLVLDTVEAFVGEGLGSVNGLFPKA